MKSDNNLITRQRNLIGNGIMKTKSQLEMTAAFATVLLENANIFASK